MDYANFILMGYQNTGSIFRIKNILILFFSNAVLYLECKLTATASSIVIIYVRFTFRCTNVHTISMISSI